MHIPGTGARRSKKDIRTFKHPVSKEETALPLIAGGITYEPGDITNQRKVGICTAAQLAQMASKVYGKKYSMDFLYLLEKKYVDKEWSEGSSSFSTLKVAQKYGFLPESEFTQIKPEDRDLPYNQYVAKLQAIPDSEVQRLIGLCENPIQGYAIVQNNRDAIAKAIQDSEAGVIFKVKLDKNWWTAPNGTISWDPKDINPLRPPTSGNDLHAITGASFNGNMLRLANTWSDKWDEQGCGDISDVTYAPLEVWIPYFKKVPDKIKKNLENQKTVYGYLLSLLQKLIIDKLPLHA